MKKENRVNHTFPAYYNKDSKILILGSFPSVRSRKENFYYMHPQNRFWKVLGTLYEMPFTTFEEKKAILKKHHIALWDVIESCTITGSSDASIQEVEPVAIMSLLEKTSIQKIFTTGKKAYTLYYQYLYPKTLMEASYLPSTSASNQANYPFPSLLEVYRKNLIEGEHPHD